MLGSAPDSHNASNPGQDIGVSALCAVPVRCIGGRRRYRTRSQMSYSATPLAKALCPRVARMEKIQNANEEMNDTSNYSILKYGLQKA